MAKKHLEGMETKVEVIENEIEKDGKVKTTVTDGAKAKGKQYRKMTREEINRANEKAPVKDEKKVEEKEIADDGDQPIV